MKMKDLSYFGMEFRSHDMSSQPEVILLRLFFLPQIDVIFLQRKVEYVLAKKIDSNFSNYLWT